MDRKSFGVINAGLYLSEQEIEAQKRKKTKYDWLFRQTLLPVETSLGERYISSKRLCRKTSLKETSELWKFLIPSYRRSFVAFSIKQVKNKGK